MATSLAPQVAYDPTQEEIDGQIPVDPVVDGQDVIAIPRQPEYFNSLDFRYQDQPVPYETFLSKAVLIDKAATLFGKLDVQGGATFNQQDVVLAGQADIIGSIDESRIV